MPTEQYDAIILGAGAAGLMCASVAGQRGKRVLLIEHADQPGKKILISGGGRCNFTNIGAGPENYLSANPHFARSALARYRPADFLELVERYQIAWHEKTLGQLFCDLSSRQILDMMLDECAKGQVELSLGQPVATVEHSDAQFRISIGARTAQAPSLVVATGGPSIPKMGATGFAYDLARQFRLKVVEPRPALVPLTLGQDDLLFRTLSGVSAEVIACAGKGSFREAALFTHRGLSGPAILQVSSYWRHGEPVVINFLPDHTPGWLKKAKGTAPRTSFHKTLAGALPERLTATLADRIGLTGELANLSDKKLAAAEQALAAWRFLPNGNEGFAKAEVTAGGVSTAELSSKSLMTRKVPGLYFIGEAVDVTGWLGGYNFQWAWASGQAAGQALE